MKKSVFLWEVGIDEAGRGPLAGPVAVGVAAVTVDFNWATLPIVGDSKKLTEKHREAVFREAAKLKRRGLLCYAVAMVGAPLIDQKGIVPAVNLAMARALRSLELQMRYENGDGREIDWDRIRVKLDGGLLAPSHCVHQHTIIKGDAKEKVIGLASIMAKVSRDRYMRRIAKLPALLPYDLARHKGYGTLAHRQAISQHGPSIEHRRSFCKNIKYVV